MKVFKRSLCIFLAVVMLFFSVNNSYFSPHKMDTVEASSVVVGGAVITADLLIKVIAALAVAGLSVGVIVEWSDMDMEAVLEDFHSWLQENTAVLDSLNIDGTSALKEWAVSDTWYVIEGGAGGSEPSPSPDNEEETETSTHGGEKLWPAGTTWTIGNLLTAGGLLAEQIYNQSVTVDSDTRAVVQAYMQARLDDFASGSAGTDPITQALQSRYVNTEPHYDGTLEQDDTGSYILTIKVSTRLSDKTYTHVNTYSSAVSTYPVFCVTDGASSFSWYLADPSYLQYHGRSFKLALPYTRYYDDGTVTTGKDNSSYSKNITNSQSWSVNVPVFNSGDYEGIDAFITSGDDSACINRERANNYIDTNDDYGWASTANISPNDLAAAMPDVAGNLDGRSVSLSGVMAAINALKNQLEENNPNTGSDVAVPYPNVDDYVSTVTDVVTDPDIFPRADDVADTAPDTEVDDVVEPAPDTDTMKDYSGLLGLIINILRDILQAIKDLLSWFVIDFAAIKAHLLLALESAPALSGIDDFLALVDYAKTQITDSYEYPVIVIDCPEILKPYWKQEQIVLLDFEDYATYFIWVRTAMAFAILFGFVIVLIKEFKVSFTLN